MDDLKLIKKHYGENMMHLCRELFPTLLETPGLLFEIMTKKFAYSKLIYDDLVEQEDIFKTIIFNETDKNRFKDDTKEHKTPKKLLEEAGYDFYECHTEEEIQAFKKYYAPNEALCTFRGNRLDRCHVFWAVKKNVDEIKREDFKNPERQDEYGTSVMSIQFDRGRSNMVSIKNRYNHTVPNPDSTFGNNLDNIIPGLADAFKTTYGYNIEYQDKYIDDLDGFILADDGKYYKYNFEDNNIYYCPNNIIIDGHIVKEYDKSRYIILENFILDLQEKTIKPYEWDDFYSFPDQFVESIGKIDKIEIINNKEDNTKTIIINGDIIIKLNKNNEIIEYKNDHVTEIGDDFLYLCNSIEVIDLPNVKKIGDDFICYIEKPIKLINLPNVEEVGDEFLDGVEEVKQLNIPKIKRTGSDFLANEKTIESIDFPFLEIIGGNFFRYNTKIKSLNLPMAKEIDGGFLSNNDSLKELYLPNVNRLDDRAFEYNEALVKVNLPNVITIGDDCFHDAKFLKELNMPKVKSIHNRFLLKNEELESINLPSVEIIGDKFIASNHKIKSLNMPLLENIGEDFLIDNYYLEEISLPLVKVIPDNFMRLNCNLKHVDLPSVELIKSNFLDYNNTLKEIYLPKVFHIEYNFMSRNNVLERVDLPDAYTVYGDFLHHDGKEMPSLKYINMPKIHNIGEDVVYKLMARAYNKVPNSDDDIEIIFPLDIVEAVDKSYNKI